MKSVISATMVALIGMTFGFGDVSAEEVIYHSSDTNQSRAIELDELLRVVQFYNADGLHCFEGSEDGYAPGTECVGTQEQCQSLCPPRHSADWKEPLFFIDLSETLRVVQLFNLGGGYVGCDNSEDGFCSNYEEEGELEGDLEGLLEGEGETEGGVEGEGEMDGEGEFCPTFVTVTADNPTKTSFSIGEDRTYFVTLCGEDSVRVEFLGYNSRNLKFVWNPGATGVVTELQEPSWSAYLDPQDSKRVIIIHEMNTTQTGATDFWRATSPPGQTASTQSSQFTFNVN